REAGLTSGRPFTDPIRQPSPEGASFWRDAMPGLPIVFVPGLLCTGRIYAHQAEHLGRTHPVLLANHWSHAAMDEIALSILDIAPDSFALVGTSMGGYVAFEIMRR